MENPSFLVVFEALPLDEPNRPDLAALAAEAMGWLPLGEGVYLHHAGEGPSEDRQVVQVVGIPDLCLAGQCVLLLTT